MATKFNEVYIEAKNSILSKQSSALTLVTNNVPGVNFKAITLAPNGGITTASTHYNVQRRELASVKDVSTTNRSSTATQLAILDSFDEVKMTNLPIATGKLRSIGFKNEMGDEFDFTNEDKHKRDVMFKTAAVINKRHQDVLDLLATATKTGSALPAHVKGDTKVWDAIADEVIRLAAIEDKFMYTQDITDFYIVTSRKVAKELAKEMGTVFNQEAAIAQTGFKSGMSVNGTAVIIDPKLTGREVYVAHNEAIAFSKQEISKSIDTQFATTKYVGIAFYDIMAIIDTVRVSSIAA